MRAARLRAIKADIGRHLGDPWLSIATIAPRHGILPRYVRKLFQEDQTTFSDFVLSQRLERSWQLLRGPSHATAAIASIAHACGFNDLSYLQPDVSPQIWPHTVGLASWNPDIRRIFGMVIG